MFFDDVFVPDDATVTWPGGVLGEVDQGWGVAMATTSSERGLTLRSPGRFHGDRDAARRPLPTSDGAADDPSLRRRGGRRLDRRRGVPAVHAATT